eukprot:403354016
MNNNLHKQYTVQTSPKHMKSTLNNPSTVNNSTMIDTYANQTQQNFTSNANTTQDFIESPIPRHLKQQKPQNPSSLTSSIQKSTYNTNNKFNVATDSDKKAQVQKFPKSLTFLKSALKSNTTNKKPQNNRNIEISPTQISNYLKNDKQGQQNQRAGSILSTENNQYSGNQNATMISIVDGQELSQYDVQQLRMKSLLSLDNHQSLSTFDMEQQNNVDITGILNNMHQNQSNQQKSQSETNFKMLNNKFMNQPQNQQNIENYCKPVKIKLRKLGDTQWEQIEEERKQKREAKANAVFGNLYRTQHMSAAFKNLKPSVQIATINQLEQNIEEHRIRAKEVQKEKLKHLINWDEKANLSKKRLENYNQQLQKLQSEREEALFNKLDKAQSALEEHQKSKQESYAYQKEMVQKRILRAKIQSLLKEKTPILCQEYMSKYDRVRIYEDKYQVQEKNFMNSRGSHPKIIYRNPENQHIIPGLADLETKKASIETPNQVLINYFTEQELQMIQDDPHYFIIDMRYRDLITIFQSDTLEAILDSKPNQKLTTYKDRFSKEQVELKNQISLDKKKKMEQNFEKQQKRLNLGSPSRNQMNSLKDLRSSNQNSSLQRIREQEAQQRFEKHQELQEKQKIAEEKRQREMLKTVNKVMDQREKVNIKQQRIVSNQERLKSDQELMKNYYAKIEQNCMSQQIKEVQEVMLTYKLKPVKQHLETWKQKFAQRSSSNFQKQNQQTMGQTFSIGQFNKKKYQL